jgi:hypothetical protein
MSVSTGTIGRRFERFVEQHARFPMSQSAQPGSAADALASVAGGLSLLTGLDATELTSAEQLAFSASPVCTSGQGLFSPVS